MILASPPGAQPDQARESPESPQRCCIVSQTVPELCIDGCTGPIAKPAVHHLEVSPTPMRSLGGHRRVVPAGRFASQGPNFTSFFVAGGPHSKSGCAPVYPSYIRCQRLPDLRKLCATKNHRRQLQGVPSSSRKCLE